MFDEVGLFDEKYFLYYEDMDFCLRAARSDFSCWYGPSSHVVHFIGGSTGMNWGTRVERMPAYWFESRRRYFVKNHGRLYAAVAELAWLAGTLARRLRRTIDPGREQDPPQYLADFLEHSILTPAGRA